jgi:hypothetical protein
MRDFLLGGSERGSPPFDCEVLGSPTCLQSRHVKLNRRRTTISGRALLGPPSASIISATIKTSTLIGHSPVDAASVCT